MVLRTSRRRFFGQAAAWSGVLFLPRGLYAARGTWTVDQVPLGKTGLRLSRIGFGTGSRGGSVQRALGKQKFVSLIRYAYDRGITYIDTAEAYGTHSWIGEAVKELPREKLFIQTKVPGVPDDVLERINRYRKELKVDYIDSVLVHCASKRSWVEDRKRVLDALQAAKQKGLIRAHGVSCHSLPALRRAVETPWVQVHLVRINPQGAHMDTPAERWNARSDARSVPAVVAELKRMKAEGRGIIGMKIIGNGDFTNPADRERSIRFAAQTGLVNAFVIGFKNRQEIDEAIERTRAALASAK